MSLTDNERKEIVKFRLEKAHEAIAELPVLMDNKFYRTAANRLYYACYYAATALLINDGYETHTHSGVKRLLGLHYIKENRIEKISGKTYDKLFSLRQTGDYDDCVSIREENVKIFLEPAEKFIAEIEKLINNNS